MIGGLLTRPAERFPELFGQNTFLIKYPYFLPCAIPATFSLIAWLVTFVFLKETHPTPISIARLFNITTDRKKPTLQSGTGTTDASPGTISSQQENLEDNRREAERPLPLRSLLTPQVLIACGNYASLSLVDIAFRAIQPVFLSTPVHLGGLGLLPPSIGTLLSIQGISNGIFQVFFFSRIHDRWGSKKTFIAGISTTIPAFIMFPVANALARTQGYGIVVWAAIGLQIIPVISMGLSFGPRFFYTLSFFHCQVNYLIQGPFLSSSPPPPLTAHLLEPQMASVRYVSSVDTRVAIANNQAQLSVSIMRATGPAAANSLFSLSIEKGYLGGYLVYCVLIFISGIALALGSMLPRRIWTAS